MSQPENGVVGSPYQPLCALTQLSLIQTLVIMYLPVIKYISFFHFKYSSSLSSIIIPLRIVVIRQPERGLSFAFVSTEYPKSRGGGGAGEGGEGGEVGGGGGGEGGGVGKFTSKDFPLWVTTFPLPLKTSNFQGQIYKAIQVNQKILIFQFVEVVFIDL